MGFETMDFLVQSDLDLGFIGLVVRSSLDFKNSLESQKGLEFIPAIIIPNPVDQIASLKPVAFNLGCLIRFSTEDFIKSSIVTLDWNRTYFSTFQDC